MNLTRPTSRSHVGLTSRLAAAVRALSRDVRNFHLVHYRHIDGFLVSGKNSGTHWLKYMLSHALAAQHGLPVPSRSSGPMADDFIGHPRWPQKYPGLPRIGSSHNLPSRILGLRPVHDVLDLPRTVVLVRDIKQAMLSHYVKWSHKLGMPLHAYVRSPLPGQRKLTDVWWFLEFFNRWGAMAHAFPNQVLIVRYEDLLAAPGYWLDHIFDHYGLALDHASVWAALAAADREAMRQRLDPNDVAEIIPGEERRASIQLDPEDDAYLSRVLAAYLKFSFGYGHALPDRPFVIRHAARQPRGVALPGRDPVTDSL